MGPRFWISSHTCQASRQRSCVAAGSQKLKRVETNDPRLRERADKESKLKYDVLTRPFLLLDPPRSGQALRGLNRIFALTTWRKPCPSHWAYAAKFDCCEKLWEWKRGDFGCSSGLEPCRLSESALFAILSSRFPSPPSRGLRMRKSLSRFSLISIGAKRSRGLDFQTATFWSISSLWGLDRIRGRWHG